MMPIGGTIGCGASGEKMPDYKTNQEAYASYRLHVEADIRDAPELQPRRERVRKVQRQEFLKMAANAWSSRYLRRMEAIEGRKRANRTLGWRTRKPRRYW
jgi:hypothetical protein